LILKGFAPLFFVTESRGALGVGSGGSTIIDITSSSTTLTTTLRRDTVEPEKQILFRNHFIG
jgi:hypothetical protein